MGNILYVQETRTEMAENKPDAKSTVGPFYIEFARRVHLGQMQLKQTCTYLFWEHSSGSRWLLELA